MTPEQADIFLEQELAYKRCIPEERGRQRAVYVHKSQVLLGCVFITIHGCPDEGFFEDQSIPILPENIPALIKALQEAIA